MTNGVTNPNKKILRVILAAAAVLILCGAFCGAAAADEMPIPVNGGKLWSGTYKLTANVDLAGKDNLYVPNGITCTIDLNGYVLKGNGAGPVITVQSGGKLTVTDSTPSAVHKFSGSLPGKLTWDSTETTGSVEIEGGCITGGKGYDGGGGVYVSYGGRFTMEGGSIVGHSLNNGGGVYTLGTFIMNGGRIIGNYARFDGGGVYVDGGSFTMNGGSITGNTAGDNGGGVFAWGDIFKMYGGSITGNSADEYGGGVCISGYTFNMYGGTISDNTAGLYGGGVFNGGTFTMEGGSITGNHANGWCGGGVADCGTVTMKGGTISKNTAGQDGGGVYVWADDTFNMYGGTISENSASHGGGVYVECYGELKMTSGEITENSAASGGGGVFVNTVINGGHLIEGYITLSGGTPVIKNNTNGSGTDDVSLRNGLLELTGVLTADADVRITNPSTAGGVFGTASGSAGGAEHITSDTLKDASGNPLGAIIVGTSLMWDDTETESADFT